MTATLSIPAANPWLAQQVRIARIIPETPGVATYELEFADPAQAAMYRFEPGQFNMLYLPGIGESAISISADPTSRERWAHTVRVAGNVTQGLAKLGVGGSLGLRGPFGSCWPLAAQRGRDLILVAGGIGLPPLRPVILHILAHRGEFGQVTLLHGARTPEGLMYERDYADWSQGGIDVETTVDRGAPDWRGAVGVVTLLLERLSIPYPSQTALFACGPDVMMHFTMRSALDRGLPIENLWLSTERNMQCAVGLCGHCQLGPAFVCKDGPVFRYDRMAPFLRVEGL
ncbi:MAG: FAD/NAD(P)-binding protein [Planctomycetales bacterium]